MSKARLVAATLLAIALLASGATYFIKPFEMRDAAPEGVALMQAMCDGGLMAWIALSHMAVAVLLVVPRARFLGGLLQLPMSLGIVAFHATMMPEGLAIGAGLLALNLVVIADPGAMHAVLKARGS